MPVLTTGSEILTTTPVIRAWWDDVKDWIDDKFGGSSGGGWGGGGHNGGGGDHQGNGNGNGSGNNNGNGSNHGNHGGSSSSSSPRPTPQQPTSTSTRSSNVPPPAHTSSSARQTNNNNGGGGGAGGGQETSSSPSSNNGSNNGSGKGNNTSSSNNFVAPSTSSADSKPTASASSSTPGVVLPPKASQDTVPPSGPVSQSTVTDSSDQQPRNSGVNLIAIILPIILVIAVAAAAFFFIWHKKRRRRLDGASVSINSNPPSAVDLHAQNYNAPTAGDPSTRSSAALLPPRSAGMAQADSRPVSMTSSTFGITNPFAGRANLDTSNAGTPYGSDAGHSVPYGRSTLNIASHSPSASFNGSIVGSAMFSTASAQHSHTGSVSTPAFEATNPFGDQARIAVVPGNQMRIINPSTDDITSQDVHIGYGAALASSVGHGIQYVHHDDGRSILSSETVRTPTSLFFKPERSSLVMGKAFPLPPQHPTIPASPISPPTPSSAAPLLGDDTAPIPTWLRSGAPSPPPKGPLPAPPSRASTYTSSRLAEWDAYDGIESEPAPVAFVQMAQRAPVQTPLMVSAPAAAQIRSHTPTMNSQLQRSPSVLTSGSDDDDYRPR